MPRKKLLEKHFKSKKELLEFYKKNKDNIEIYRSIEETPEEYVVSMKHCLKPNLIKKGKPSYTLEYYEKEMNKYGI